MNIEPVQRATAILGSQSALAKSCNVSQPAVSGWLKGIRQPTGKSARAIELATGGLVTRGELRPDIFY